MLDDDEWRTLPYDDKRNLRDDLAMAVALAKVKRAERYPWQVQPRVLQAQESWFAMGGRGCVQAGTLVDTVDHGPVPVEQLDEAVEVVTLDGSAMMDGPSFWKGEADLYRVAMEDGRTIVTTDQHRFLTPGGWLRLADVRVGSRLACSTPAPSLANVYRHLQVRSITCVGRDNFYDLTVPGPSHYVGNGIVSHNTGKTQIGAMHVIEHVTGPACDPDSPGGHRPLIVAPTVGDAVESCVDGPSGLSSYIKGMKATTRAGGTYVEFPNGVVARLTGAMTKSDLENLRSRAGNRCVLEGTPVLTMRGEVPIEDVRALDQVWTRGGWRPVTATWDNGLREVVTVHLDDGSTLEVTDDHEVHGPRGWVRAGLLAPGDALTGWTPPLGPTPPTSPSGETCGSTTAADPDGAEGNCSTGRSTARRTASPATTTCTTSTTTRSTTTPPTSPPIPQPSTGPSTATSAEKTGTLVEERPRGTTPSGARSPALSAATPSGRGRLWTPNTAAPAVPSAPDSSATVSPQPVRSAVSSSSHARAARPSPADRRVVRADRTGRVGTVYDLTVHEFHEFVASGVLVANCCVWLEEYAAMRLAEKVLDQVRLGLRLGPRPHLVITSTPKPRKAVRDLVDDPSCYVTHGRTRDAVHLDPAVRAVLVAKYAGTRLEKQELDGELLDEVEGALADYDLLDAIHIDPADVPHGRLGRRIVAIDPAVTAKAGSDETGMIVAGADYTVTPSVGYVLADLSGVHQARGRDGWPARALRAYHEHGCNAIVAEGNNGGDLVAAAIKQTTTTVLDDDGREVELSGEHVPVEVVHATRGKAIRAEPVALAMESNRWKHADAQAGERRDQWATWVPGDGDDSPDRLDAEVWAATFLILGGRQGAVMSASDEQGVKSGRTGSSLPQTQRRITRDGR